MSPKSLVVLVSAIGKKKLKYSTTFSIGRHDKIWKQREGVRKRRAICNERNVVHRLKKKVIAPPCYPLLRDNHCNQYYTHTRTHTRATLNPRAEKLRLEKWITRIARYAIANVTARRALPLTNVEFFHFRYNEASRGETTCACVKKKIKKLT